MSATCQIPPRGLPSASCASDRLTQPVDEVAVLVAQAALGLVAAAASPATIRLNSLLLVAALARVGELPRGLAHELVAPVAEQRLDSARFTLEQRAVGVERAPMPIGAFAKAVRKRSSTPASATFFS